MPARKIPKNHLSVTGKFASRKNGATSEFESILEKENILLLEFDESVEGFDVQPITIPVPGVPRGYTPDVLIRYHPDPATGEFRISRLTEVKHTEDLKRNAEKYALKFALANQYAVEQGWEFSITTEKEIRIPRLANLKFLREYRNIAPEEADRWHVARYFRAMDSDIPFGDLLEGMAATEEDKLRWLPVIWHMVLHRQLRVDLDAPLNNQTALSLPDCMP